MRILSSVALSAVMALSFFLPISVMVLQSVPLLVLTLATLIIPIALLFESVDPRRAVRDPKATVQELAITGTRFGLFPQEVLVSSQDEKFRLKVAAGRRRVEAALATRVP